MSDYFETYRPDSSVILNGYSVGGVFLGVVVCPATTSGKVSFPYTHHGGFKLVFAQSTNAHFIRTYDAVGQSGMEGHVEWNYNVNAWQSDTILYVFARNIDPYDNFGIQLLNQAGETVADQTYPAPTFVNWVLTNPQAASSVQTPDGYWVHRHYVTIAGRENADRFITMAMPDVGNNDTWYHLTRNFFKGGEVANLDLLVFTKASSYVVPTLHLFALNKPLSGNSDQGFQLFSPSGENTFDSGVEIMVNLMDLDVSPGDYGSSGNGYSLPPKSLPGISPPLYMRYAHSGSNKETFVGAAKKSGGQMIFTTLMLARTPWQAGDSEYNINGTYAGWTPVVDLTHLSPGVQTGIPVPGGGGGGEGPPPDTSSLHIDSFTPGGTYPSGTVVTLSMTATGIPTPSCTIEGPNGPIASGTGSASGDVTVSSATAGTYWYTAANSSAGSAALSVILAVQDEPPPPPPDTTPVFTQQPTDCNIASGQDASFTCAASPVTSYQWYQDGALMPGETGNSLYLSPRGISYDLVQFYCVAINGNSSKQSQTATLHVSAPASVPFQTYQDINAYIEDLDNNPVSFSIYNDGSSDDDNWGIPPGDGSLYRVTASFNSFVTGPTSGDLGVSSSLTWRMGPATKGGRQATVNINIYLKNGGLVSSSQATLSITNGTIL